MATMDNNEREELVRGNEWEVVGLTESVYAAAPGPKQDVLRNSHSNLTGDDNAETSHVMFMSNHYEFSPSTHENLPLESEYKEKCEVSQVTAHQGVKSDSKHEESLRTRGLNEFLGGEQYDEKGSSMSFYNSDFGDIMSSDVIEKEQSMYSSGKLSEGTGIAEPFEFPGRTVNPGPSNIGQDKFTEVANNLPCQAWWRKHGASLYDRAKNANPFWSIAVAAAVMGLVIIGQRWQRDKPQVFQLKSQLVIDNEGSSWALGPTAQLKDVTSTGHHVPYIRVSFSTER